MLFSDKLIFLMDLTGTSNLALAKEIGTNPAQISLMRTGQRGAPQKSERLRAMAEYFAKKSTTAYHRAALAETLERQQLKLTLEPYELADEIYTWLSGDRELPGLEAERFLHEIENINVSIIRDLDALPKTPGKPRGHGNYLYYGNDGRRAALTEFLDYISSLDEPCEVVSMSEENPEWLLEAPIFARGITEKMLCLTCRGFSCRRIATTLIGADAAFDSLSRWLPLYLTGRVRSYYYPRLRDDLYRSTIYAVPGKAALVGISIGFRTQLNATLFTTDPSMSEIFLDDFEAYFERCLPMTTTYDCRDNFNGLWDYIIRFESFRSISIRRSGFLSAVTTPPELLARITDGRADADEHQELFRRARTAFESNLADFRCVEVLFDAGVEAVAAGRIPIALSYLLNSEPLFYTVGEYLLHLRRMLALLERWDNYLVIWEENSSTSNTVYVKERLSAALIRSQPPYTVFEISEPNTVSACQDFLNRAADSNLNWQTKKQRAVFKLHELIHDFELAARETK